MIRLTALSNPRGKSSALRLSKVPRAQGCSLRTSVSSGDIAQSKLLDPEAGELPESSAVIEEEDNMSNSVGAHFAMTLSAVPMGVAFGTAMQNGKASARTFLTDGQHLRCLQRAMQSHLRTASFAVSKVGRICGFRGGPISLPSNFDRPCALCRLVTLPIVIREQFLFKR